MKVLDKVIILSHRLTMNAWVIPRTQKGGWITKRAVLQGLYRWPSHSFNLLNWTVDKWRILRQTNSKGIIFRNTYPTEKANSKQVGIKCIGTKWTPEWVSRGYLWQTPSLREEDNLGRWLDKLNYKEYNNRALDPRLERDTECWQQKFKATQKAVGLRIRDSNKVITERIAELETWWEIIGLGSEG